MFLFSLLTIFFVTDDIPEEGWEILQVVFVPIFTLTPRFIIKIRDLYARDVEGRRWEGIDTGFGLPSLDRGAGETGMVFAVGRQQEELEEVELRTTPRV